jgi:hypothetical protein
VDTGYDLQRLYVGKAGPHLLQVVSEGEAKVSTTLSGEVPWRGVSRRVKAACSLSEARRAKSGSSLEIGSTNIDRRSRRTGGKTTEPQPDLAPVKGVPEDPANFVGGYRKLPR